MMYLHSGASQLASSRWAILTKRFVMGYVKKVCLLVLNNHPFRQVRNNFLGENAIEESIATLQDSQIFPRLSNLGWSVFDEFFFLRVFPSPWSYDTNLSAVFAFRLVSVMSEGAYWLNTLPYHYRNLPYVKILP